jgi:hypothetical protein
LVFLGFYRFLVFDPSINGKIWAFSVRGVHFESVSTIASITAKQLTTFVLTLVNSLPISWSFLTAGV